MEPEETKISTAAAAARTPLLAVDETPIHLGQHEIEEQTEFARLLALNPVPMTTNSYPFDPKHRSNRFSRGGTGRFSQYRQDPVVGSSVGTHPPSLTTLTQTQMSIRPAALDVSQSSSPTGGLVPLCPLAFVTVMTGSLAVLHIGFVWRSYVSSDWAETILQIHVPFIVPSSSAPYFLTTVQSTKNLASLLGTLDESRQPIAAVWLWITSLLIPCFCMVLSPSWIVADHQKRNETIMGSPRPNAIFRDAMEMTVRWAFTVVYVVMVLAVASQYVSFHWTGTSVAIHNRIMPGFVSFVVGISSALGVIVLLRLQKPMIENSSSTGTDNTVATTAATSVEPSRMGLPNFPSLHQTYNPHTHPPPDDDDEESAGMRVLEEQLLLNNNNTVTPLQQQPTTVPTTNAPRPRYPSFFQLLLVFQLGLLSLLLWFPAVLIPFVNLRYSGIAAKFMTNEPNPMYSVALYHVPWLLIQDSLSARSKPWVLAITGGLLFFVTILVPIVAIVLGILTWMLPNRMHVDQRSSERGCCCCARVACKRWLYAIHPATGSIVMAVALIVAIPIIQPWTQLTLNFHTNSEGEKETKGICDVLIQVVGESCLEIRPAVSSGLYFLIAHATFLELFILLTLRWS
jgi:hypothetical protein